MPPLAVAAIAFAGGLLSVAFGLWVARQLGMFR